MMLCRASPALVPVARSLHRSLPALGLPMSSKIAAILLQVFVSAGDVDACLRVCSDVQKLGLQLDPVDCAAMIYACALRAERPSDRYETLALALFQRAVSESMVIRRMFTSLMFVFAATGNEAEAHSAFSMFSSEIGVRRASPALLAAYAKACGVW
eukprot:TRINITY_DN59551_c0_g1_i1.p1 TRINITY_DN59551_c0_g1~~TRINITY_DN59551_c0_g1_i1.p1  ORF type:complete len:182 (+),score=52.37 TRINITY_DN59551_c0_g1_i1:80-547(+)